jgi:hypothetical protein
MSKKRPARPEKTAPIFPEAIIGQALYSASNKRVPEEGQEPSGLKGGKFGIRSLENLIMDFDLDNEELRKLPILLSQSFSATGQRDVSE